MSEPIDEYWKRGIELSEAGKFAEAVSEWREAVKLHPDWVDMYDPAALHGYLGYFLAAQAIHDRGDLRPAQEAFEAVLKTRPTSGNALRNLGELQWLQGEKREAIETLKAAVAADPTNSSGYRRLARKQLFSGNWQGVQTILAMVNMLDSEGRAAELDESYQRGMRFIVASLVIVVGVGLLWKLTRKLKP